jgi:transaldolase
MALFLDSANLDEILKMIQFPFISGIFTTTQSIKKESLAAVAHLKKIGEICSGSIFSEVQSLSAPDILNEAKFLGTLMKDRIYVQIPFCEEGLKTIRILNEDRILTCLTGVVNPFQVYLSAQVGAACAVVHIDRIEDAKKDGMEVIRNGIEVIEANKVRMKLVAAGISSQKIAEQLLTIPRVDIALPCRLLLGMIKDPLTSKYIAENIR